MANFGLTEKGFVRKRLPEILSDERQRAVSLFQDLVEPGDVVDTSSSSALGRLIAIVSANNAELWETAEEVYQAFDPNSSTGIALDNLVALSGIFRSEGRASTATCVVGGDTGTIIPEGSAVRSIVGGSILSSSTQVTLNNIRVVGLDVQVINVLPETQYTIQYSTNSFVIVANYTSGTSPTASEILNGIAESLNINEEMEAVVEDDVLVINKTNIFVSSDFTLDSNLVSVKSRKTVTFVADEIGSNAYPRNTITNIVTPVLGWDSVNNPFDAVSGNGVETDTELRSRFQQSKGLRAVNTLDSLYAGLYSIDEVVQVRVYETPTDVYNADYDIPGHSFRPIVMGGDIQDIGREIWTRSPFGILSVGNTTVSVADSQGISHTVSFDRPVERRVTISMELTIDDNFPADGAEQIRVALVNYFSENVGIGDKIRMSRLYTPINSVRGHYVEDLVVKLDGWEDTENLGIEAAEIAFNEIPSLSSEDISVRTERF